jgi:hypothetical protein
MGYRYGDVTGAGHVQVKRGCVITRGEPDLKFETISPIPDDRHALEAANLPSTRRFTKPATTPSN